METSGVTLTVIGMGVVFLALMLLALAAWILERMFRVPEVLPGRAGAAVVDTEQQITPEIEAVITVALFHYTRKRGSIRIERADESVWIQHTRVYT
jgi:sodium pump decarboxylase gamma subunit